MWTDGDDGAGPDAAASSSQWEKSGGRRSPDADLRSSRERRSRDSTPACAPDGCAEPAGRREWLFRTTGALGAVALAELLGRDARLAAGPAAREITGSLAVSGGGRVPARAKAVICLHMHGGPSQVDTFDPKPALQARDGQPPPEELHRLQLQFTDVSRQKLMASRQAFTRCGESGIEICDSLPRLQRCADELCVIRSMHHEQFNHTPAIWFQNTGSSLPGRPSLGAWLSYGLGCATRELPAFVVMHAKPLKPGPGVWGSGFLPAVHQGMRLNAGPVPIPSLRPSIPRTAADERAGLDYLRGLNARHAAARHDSRLDARIASYELACRMQAAAPEAVDLSRETRATRDLYGPNFGEQCLIARRLVERGVRCVQIYHVGPDPANDWDTHGANHEGQSRRMQEVDQGCAALLVDLRARGLLDETLVVWGGEFGRTPTTEGGSGRDHNPYGYSLWMAGGGVRRGIVHGGTDDFGFRAVEAPVHLHDLNATLLHLFGIDHERLTWRHSGRDFRLTDVFGKVVTPILA